MKLIKIIPLKLGVIFFTVLLTHSLSFADPKQDCENLDELFTPLGQLVISNLTTPPLEKLCRHIYKAKTYASRGKEAKAIRQLEIIIRITTNQTPEFISVPAQDAFNAEALRLIDHFEIRLALPEDPGAAGKETLEGLDQNGNFLRDDIERYIALTHVDSAKYRAVLTQFAKHFQEKLIYADDPIKSVALGHERMLVGACEEYIDSVVIHSFQGREFSPRKKLIAQLLNTVERSRAYFRYNDHLAGNTFMDPEPAMYDKTPLKKYCDFDVDSLPN